jgi:uracil-DNA glycosylase
VKSEQFKILYREAQACTVCPKLADKVAVLSEMNGSLDPKVFFIGEAPGRVGADRTRRPFYGDKSGNNLQMLLDSIDLKREDIFITSAVMCSPRSATDANRRPSRSEIVNCSSYLKRQLDLIDPPVIATLGSVALEAIKTIAYHEFSPKTHVGSILDWNNVKLVPLYHPSPQVMASSRRMTEQIQDYQVLSQALRLTNERK